MLRKLVAYAVLGAMSVGVCGSMQAADKPKVDVEAKFKALDKNGDGKISLDEYVGKKTGPAADKIKAAFKAKDTDGDGNLTLEEYKAKPAKKPQTN